MEPISLSSATGDTASGEALDLQRVLVFCLLAFAISGTAALYVASSGGLESLTWLRGLLLLGLWYMSGPAFAHLLTRLITREGWDSMWLRPRFRRGWPAWIVAWFLPALLVIAGSAFYFLLFPSHFDSSFRQMRALLEQTAAATNEPPSFGPEILIVLQIVQALFLAPLLNALPTLGEEFGWRAYLQPKLMVLGWRRAMLWMGLIWGAWHWPIIALGYNFGLDYPGAPWVGMLLFAWFTTTFGIILGWLTIRGGSVWPAVIGHGALNGIAALPGLVLQGTPNLLLGPLAHGLIAGLPMALVALWLWWNIPEQR